MIVAAQRADEMLDRGDLDGQAVSFRILRACRKMMSKETHTVGAPVLDTLETLLGMLRNQRPVPYHRHRPTWQECGGPSTRTMGPSVHL